MNKIKFTQKPSVEGENEQRGEHDNIHVHKMHHSYKLTEALAINLKRGAQSKQALQMNPEY